MPPTAFGPAQGVAAHGAAGAGTRPALLTPAACHELFAGRDMDGAAMTGFAFALALADSRPRPILWVRHAMIDRESGAPSPSGVSEFGLDPARVILAHLRDVTSVLQAGLEGARCAGFGTVLVELWGEAKAYDMTASRRLTLAARTSGVTLLVARMAGTPRPTTAETRWRIRAAPSRGLAANAPGPPAFEMTLLRARNGQEGLSYQVEWDRDAQRFNPVAHGAADLATAPDTARARPPLPGTVVAFPADRPGPAGGGPDNWRRAG